MTQPRIAMFTQFLPASAPVAAGPLRAARQSRSLVVASNAALQLLRPNGAGFSVSDRPPTSLSRAHQTNLQTKSPRLGHTVEP
jgi:hypothetical protein